MNSWASMKRSGETELQLDGVPIELASDLAGHASIDTTSICSTQELAREFKAERGMKARVAA
jgi:hypothetical protein